MTPPNIRYMAHRANDRSFHNGQRPSRGLAIGLLFGSMRGLGCCRHPPPNPRSKSITAQESPFR
jgi:hypothetical protein